MLLPVPAVLGLGAVCTGLVGLGPKVGPWGGRLGGAELSGSRAGGGGGSAGSGGARCGEGCWHPLLACAELLTSGPPHLLLPLLLNYGNDQEVLREYVLAGGREWPDRESCYVSDKLWSLFCSLWWLGGLVPSLTTA